MITFFRASRCSLWRISRRFAAVLAGSAALVAWAAPPGVPDAAPATQPAARGAVSERAPEYPHSSDVPTELLRPGKPQAIILPSVPAESPDALADEARSGGVIDEVTPTEQLLPEGYVLARRPARFGRDEAWWAIAIGEVAGLPTGPPLRILPNRRLMLLERLLAEGKPEDTYLVTGRVTEFLGRNYILLEQVVSPPEQTRTPPNDTAPPGPAAPESPASTPTRPPSPSEIIDQLMQDAPARVPRIATAAARVRADTQPAEQATEDARRVQPEGTVVPEFPARLVRSEPWWTLVRESSGSRPAGEPYYVLPNRMLEVMVSASAGATRSVVFLVSGELTEYRKTNYLLVHKVLIRRDMGNLR